MELEETRVGMVRTSAACRAGWFLATSGEALSEWLFLRIILKVALVLSFSEAESLSWDDEYLEDDFYFLRWSGEGEYVKLLLLILKRLL